jgi:hypothetical protein
MPLLEAVAIQQPTTAVALTWSTIAWWGPITAVSITGIVVVVLITWWVAVTLLIVLLGTGSILSSGLCLLVCCCSVCRSVLRLSLDSSLSCLIGLLITR